MSELLRKFELPEDMISVIIPLYNKAATIQRTLDSVYRQTYTNFEVLVVNDESTDGGPDIIKDQTDSRVHLITRSNGGQGAARNSGMKNAKGNIFAFLDADDTWGSDHLENLYQLHLDYPEAEVFGTGYRLVYADSSQRPIAHKISRGYISYFLEFSRLDTPILTASSTAVSRNAVERVGLIDETVPWGGDLLYWAQLALKCKIAFEPKVSMDYYVETVGNLSARRNDARITNTVISPSFDYLEECLSNHRIPVALINSVVLYNQATILRAAKQALVLGRSSRARHLLYKYWSKRHFILRGAALSLLALLPDTGLRYLLQLRQWLKGRIATS